MLRHTITEGLGGTGKTFQLEREIIELPHYAGNILYLCFNKNLQIKKTVIMPVKQNLYIKTFHSYIYHLLYFNDSLPVYFKNKEKNVDLSNKDLNRGFYQSFENIKSLLKSNSLGIDIKYSHIYVDEYQDFTFEMLEILMLLQLKMKSYLHFYGDPTQRLYVDGKLKRDNRIYSPKEMVEKTFSNIDFSYEVLTVSYRSNLNIQLLANKFLNEYFNTPLKYNTDQVKEKQNDPVPTISYFNHQEQELEYVKEQIKRDNSKNKIFIISTYKRDLLIYQDDPELLALTEDGKLTIGTIKSVKGDDADLVFWIAVQNIQLDNKNLKNQKELYYVGLSRSKRKNVFSTSYPKADLDDFWTSIKTDKSKQKKYYNNLKTNPICKALNKYDKTSNSYEVNNKRFTKNNFTKSSIDSLSFKIPAIYAPYIPFIPKEYKNNTNNYYDLNPLKKLGLTDLIIVELCESIIQNFFNNRLDSSVIKLQRIDIANIFDMKKIESINNLETEIQDLLISKKHNSFIGYMSKEDTQDYDKYNDTWKSNEKYTLYLNEQKKKINVLSIYRPANKNNKNGFSNKDLLKVESRKIFPGKNGKYTIETLKDIIKGGTLKEELSYLLSEVSDLINKEVA